MRGEFLGCVSALLATAGLALAQPTPPPKLPPSDLPPGAPPIVIDTAPSGAASPASDGAAAIANGAATGDNTNRSRGPTKEELRDDHIGPPERIWVNGDYLLWWFKDGPLPVPVVTTGPAGSNGAIGAPGVTTVIGNQTIDYGDHSGGRVSLGAWLDDCHRYGAEVGGFVFQRRSVSFAAASDATGTPALASPFFDQIAGAPSSFVISTPGRTGSARVDSSSSLWGLDAGFVRNLADNANFRADLTFGFRYLDLNENLAIDRTSVQPAGGGLMIALQQLAPGATLSVSDRFDARNQVYAGYIGGRTEYRMGSFSLGVQGRVALGPNHESVGIQGTTTATPLPAAVPAPVPGGLLALPGTNLSRETTDWFVVAPEGGVQLGYQVTEHIRLQVGYDFLYVNSVVRPGQQVDLHVNSNLVPTSSAFGSGTNGGGGSAPNLLVPTNPMRQEDFWAHGINAGVAFSF